MGVGQETKGTFVVSSSLIGAMSALSLVLGGAALVQFLRKSHGQVDDELDVIDDLESTSTDHESIESNPVPTLGVPSIHWGGLDHGRKMQIPS